MCKIELKGADPIGLSDFQSARMANLKPCPDPVTWLSLRTFGSLGEGFTTSVHAWLPEDSSCASRLRRTQEMCCCYEDFQYIEAGLLSGAVCSHSGRKRSTRIAGIPPNKRDELFSTSHSKQRCEASAVQIEVDVIRTHFRPFFNTAGGWRRWALASPVLLEQPQKGRVAA